jgi:hypothetical protein
MSPPEPEPPDDLKLIAYELHRDHGFTLVPASPRREWMDLTAARFANRCLPLLMANQAGWLVLNNADVRARWHGGEDRESIEFDYDTSTSSFRPVSHFGHGIITWNLPFLFRTPPGFNLLVRGPANAPKRGISALEGIVETDWSPAAFTMNWKFTRRHRWVSFAKGEPVCVIVPQRRGELDRFSPTVVPMDAAPAELRAAYDEWRRGRRDFIADLGRPGSAAAQAGWQKDYFRGANPDGSTAPEHETRMRLKPFSREG